MPNQHVLPSSNGGWNVKADGAKRATKHFDTQKEANEFAKIIASNQQAEVSIHGRNGKIREKNSYGHDPRHING